MKRKSDHIIYPINFKNKKAKIDLDSDISNLCELICDLEIIDTDINLKMANLKEITNNTETVTNVANVKKTTSAVDQTKNSEKGTERNYLLNEVNAMKKKFKRFLLFLLFQENTNFNSENENYR